MQRTRIPILITLAAALFCALFMACSLMRSSVPTRNYYIINYTPQSTAPVQSRRPYPYSLQMGRFEVQRTFNRLNIIYRYSPNLIQYYDLERWAVRPDYMIGDMVFKHLDSARLVNRLGVEFFDSRPDYRIEGTVEAIEKLDAGDLFFGHLAMTIKLVDIATANEVWSYSFDRRRQVYSEDMVQTVRTLSDIFQTQMDVVVGQLDSLFLAKSSGRTLDRTTIPRATPQASPAAADSTAPDTSGVDESSFDIIREVR